MKVIGTTPPSALGSSFPPPSQRKEKKSAQESASEQGTQTPDTPSVDTRATHAANSLTVRLNTPPCWKNPSA